MKYLPYLFFGVHIIQVVFGTIILSITAKELLYIALKAEKNIILLISIAFSTIMIAAVTIVGMVTIIENFKGKKSLFKNIVAYYLLMIIPSILLNINRPEF